MKKIKIKNIEKKNKKFVVEATANDRKVFLFFQKERDNLSEVKCKKIIEGLK